MAEAESNQDDSKRKKKKTRNPFKAYREYQLRKKLERERLLLAREEKMKEDLERYLMQMEEQRCWVAYHLRHVNAERMKKLNVIRRIHRIEQKKDEQEAEDNLKEDGLNFYQGNVVSFQRWQNSPAKYRDFIGHKEAVTSCRLSPCSKYILSCSGDTNMRIWDLASAECLKTYSGHAKVVNDADLHPRLFKMYSLTLNIVSASGDGTIRLWNTSDTKPMTTIFAHQSAVYRCLFSPDGNTIISCSEDKTIKTWNYPEGYNIFVYTAHESPVISLRYSQSGRYFVSGSDYGERKIMLWDAKYPHMYEPAKFPHIIYWTSTGLIRKIIIRRDNPRPGFWLAQTQLTWISSDKNLDIWPGEMSDDDTFAENQDSDGEGEDGEDDDDDAPKKQDKVDKSREGDIYEKEGVFINVLKVGENGEKDSAIEYNPGGTLIVKVQSMDYYIEEAYLGAIVKDTMMDIYSPNSGRKAGAFVLDAPIPWLPMLSKLDSSGKKFYYRQPPEYVSQSKDGSSINYLPEKGQRKIPDSSIEEPSSAKESKQTKEDTPKEKDSFEIVWNCPEPLLGTVVLVFNFRLKDYENNWIQLRYSMKESPIRVGEYAIVGENKETEESKQFKFNQEKKHISFWNFIRDKNWTAAASYIDKYAVAWVRDDVIRRRFRIMNLLVSMFEDTDWLILHAPFKFKSGVTKSVVLCEADYGDYGEDEDEIGGGDEKETKEAKADKTESSKEEDPMRLLVGSLTLQLSTIPESAAEVTADQTVSSSPQIPNVTELEHQKEAIPPEQEVPVPEDLHVEPSPESRLSGVSAIAGTEKNGVTSDKSGAEDSSNRKNKESKDGDEPWLGSKDDLVANAGRFRPQTQSQHLPSVIYTTAVGSKKMDRTELEIQAKKQASLEVNRIMALLQGTIDIMGEMPMNARRGAVLELLPKPDVFFDNASQQIERRRAAENMLFESQEIHRFQAIDYDLVMETFDSLIAEYKHLGQLSVYEQSDMAKELQAKAALFPDMLESAEGGPVVKSGRFGPEIDEFSMPLPALYPSQAGAAKYALQPALEWFQTILRKLYVESLPRTMAEVYEPGWRERLQTWYHKLNRTQEKQFREKLLTTLQEFIQVQMMQDMAYVSTRRQTHHHLPGLVLHYPNPYYSNPAAITPDLQYPPPPKGQTSSFVDKLFGRTVNKSIIVPPVGRKPDRNQAFELQKQAYGASSQTLNTDSLLPKKSQYSVNVLDNLLATDEDERKKKLNRAKSKKIQKGKSKRVVMKTALVEYPAAFYQERRGFYHQLPGLEEFANDAILAKEGVGDEDSGDDDEEFSWEDPPGLLCVFTIKDGLESAHHGAINDVIFSPSELRVASAGGDRLVKIWDPRDGTYVRSLVGHEAEVISVRFTSSEQFLISAGGDAQIIIWSLLTQTIQRRLRGHVDVITMLDLVPDGSLLLSSSQDHTLKTWCTTPRHPVAPDPPKIISFTEHSVYIGWTAPPSFNCDITAFHYQLRVGTRGEWKPENGQSIAPHLRNRVIEGIIPATPYQFRICAENTMGKSEWSAPSALVRTAFGLPEPVERPFISLVSRTSQHIVWFTPNPTTYGSAATAFEVQYVGNGKGYEENPTLRFDLDQIRAYGSRVLNVFRKIRQRKEELKNKLIKSQQFHMRTRQSLEDKADYEVSEAMSSETVFEILNRAEEDSFLLVGCEVPNLRPGFLYTIRVRGSNVVGLGAWSTPTLSSSTKPTIPDVPNAPRVVHASLRYLTLQWDPPHDDGGSAITGYRLHLLSSDRYIELPRSSVSYKWNGLFPGRSYRCRVLAKNGVGESAFSESNSEQGSYTQTAPPDTPQNPVAVEGTWSLIVYEVDIPYHNGARITHMEYEYRRVEPFNIGEWIRCPHIFSVLDNSQDVTFIKRVDLDKQQEDMEASVRALELAARSMKKASGGAISESKTKKSTLPSSSKKKSVPSDASALDQQIEAMILSQRPVGHRIRFTVDNLEQDAMFEVRICFTNSAGTGSFSAPSHRAKTNKAALPGAVDVPDVITIGQNYLLLELKVPDIEGGAAIRFFQIENMDLDDNRTTTYKCLRGNNMTGTGLSTMESYRMDNLIPGHSYLLRYRAESPVGFGPFSSWTKEVNIPAADDDDVSSIASGNSARSSMTAGSQSIAAAARTARSIDSQGGGRASVSRAGSIDSVGLGDSISAVSSVSQSVASSRLGKK